MLYFVAYGLASGCGGTLLDNAVPTQHLGFNCKKVGGLIENNTVNSFGFNALRRQHDKARYYAHQAGLGKRSEATRAPGWWHAAWGGICWRRLFVDFMLAPKSDKSMQHNALTNQLFCS